MTTLKPVRSENRKKFMNKENIKMNFKQGKLKMSNKTLRNLSKIIFNLNKKGYYVKSYDFSFDGLCIIFNNEYEFDKEYPLFLSEVDTIEIFNTAERNCELCDYSPNCPVDRSLCISGNSYTVINYQNYCKYTKEEINMFVDAFDEWAQQLPSLRLKDYFMF